MWPRKCPAEIHPQIGPQAGPRPPPFCGGGGCSWRTAAAVRPPRAAVWPAEPVLLPAGPPRHRGATTPARPPSGPLPPAWSLCPESHRDVAVPPPSNLSTRSRPSLPFRLVVFSPRTHGRLPSGFASVRRSAPLRGTRSPPLAFDGAGHRLRACGRYPLNDLFPH